MSISAVSSSGADPTSFQKLRSEIRQDIGNLQSSLQSNNLSGAQSAFSSLQQLLPGNSGTSSAAPTDSTASTFRSDIDALGKALSSGDLTGAQQAFSNLQNLAGSNQSGQTQAVSSDSSGTDPITNDFNNLSKALQSGNLTDAQSAFKQLQSDLSSQDATQAAGHHNHHHQAAADSTSTASTASTSTVSVLG